MADEDLRARIDELEAENARLRAFVEPGKRVAGGKVIAFFGIMLALAFAVALTLWSMAKKTSQARADAQNANPPTQSRVDAAGRALVHAIAECVGANEGPLDVRLRVKLTPDGALGILDAGVTPESESITQCVRRAPSLVHVLAGDAQPADVKVTYSLRTEGDGTRVTRKKWEVRPVGER